MGGVGRLGGVGMLGGVRLGGVVRRLGGCGGWVGGEVW